MADVLFSQLLTHPVNVSSFSSSSGVTFHILFCFFFYFLCGYSAFIFLSWRNRHTILQTPHASLIEESVDVQPWRQMHLHSRIHVVSVVIVQSVKTVKLWWWQWFNKIRRCSVTVSVVVTFSSHRLNTLDEVAVQLLAPDRFQITSVISHIHLNSRGETETHFSDCHLFTFSRPSGTHFSDVSLLHRVKFLSPAFRFSIVNNMHKIKKNFAKNWKSKKRAAPDIESQWHPPKPSSPS